MLSYADRLKIMRDTKIRHTLEKRDQNGYTDLDDFGTVPITPDYEVEPYYNSENGSFYGYDGMSENFVRVINAHPAYVDPMEMLCARWRDMLVNYRGDLHYMPDWLKNKPKTIALMKSVTNQWSKRWDEQRFPYDDLKPLQKKYNIQTGIDGDAHLACDYRIGFELGFGGLLEKIKKYRDINKDKKDFYDAEEKVLLAIIDFVQKHIDEIERLLKEEKRPEIVKSLEEMLMVNKNIKYGAPKTFYEVCQWTAYFNCASRIYTRDGAGFQLDTLLYPYYENDIKNGILDDEKAKFLIANLLLIDPHYYQISGVDENDNDMTNKLTYLILDAADSINISCNLTVRVHKNCDKNLLKKAIYYLLKNKNGWPRFCNDDALSEGYMKNGVDKKTARERIAVGCNWMCVPGKEFPMNDTVKINIAKVFEVALNEMKNDQNKSVEKLYEIYKKHLKEAIRVTADGINLHIEHQWEVTPELVMNLMMEDTIEKGEDISRCAKLYTVGVDGIGLAVVADSFGALETRVEKENVLTWDEVYVALENNFEDERVRLILNSTPKYCHGNTVSDAWAKKLTESWVEGIKSHKMPQGRTLVPGWFSWARTIEYGKAVGATPNGRRKQEPVSHGANPNPHFRSDGAVTAQSNGIASVQCGYGNTAPLQIEFDPDINIENGGVDIIENFILGHFEQGGTLININILDKEKLIEANKNPDLHPDLVVRVTGFTAYFASLSPQFRQLVVDRFLTGI
ncbi:MAG: formate acetyltransferase [Ruminococcaceae bacterium]|nr:formate acetyltransferase [Oscillospiraceae bacterium]